MKPSGPPLTPLPDPLARERFPFSLTRGLAPDLNQELSMTEPTFTLDDSERQPCEIWTRVMGYHRPMSSFNIGKQGEFHERRYFTEQRASLNTQPCAA